MQQRLSLVRLVAVAALVGAAACSNESVTNPTQQLLTEQMITEDVALSSGHAIANDVGELFANESFVGLAPQGGFRIFASPPGVTATRTRTCYDENDQPQAQCDPLTTSYIVLTLELDGSFLRVADGPRGLDSMAADIHRDRTLTISGLLGTETSRTHDGNGSAHDTTRLWGSHDGHTFDRLVVENAVDSVQGVVLDLPHWANPFPVDGRIVRVVEGSVTLTLDGETVTRTFSRRIEVSFPADAQGNVTMVISVGTTTKTCLLNLVTRRVHSCT